MAMKEGQGMLHLLFEQGTGKCVASEHFPTIFLGATMCLIRQMSSFEGSKIYNCSSSHRILSSLSTVTIPPSLKCKLRCFLFPHIFSLVNINTIQYSFQLLQWDLTVLPGQLGNIFNPSWRVLGQDATEWASDQWFAN